MPLTIFHLGPGLFLGTLLEFLNLWAVLLGSVVMDLEPAILILYKKCYYCPHHAFFHSFLGAIVGSLILSLILWLFRGKLNYLSQKLKIHQDFSFKNLYFSSLIFWSLHVILDSIVYFNIRPFWPLKTNPLFISMKIYTGLNFLLIILLLYGIQLAYKKYKTDKTNI